MILNIKIESIDKGIICSATIDGTDAFNNIEANTFVIGALEIAKASLLARRWGVEIGSPLVDPPEDVLKEEIDPREDLHNDLIAALNHENGE